MRQRDNDKDNDEKEKKEKKRVLTSYSICRQPKCAQRITSTDEQDPDLQIAKHNKAVHDIPFPDWVDIVWDRTVKPKYRKPYEKKVTH